VAMENLLDAAEVMVERGDTAGIDNIVEMIAGATPHFMRDDMGYYPSEFDSPRNEWTKKNFGASWRAKAFRIYPELQRLRGAQDGLTDRVLAKAEEHHKGWAGRDATAYLAPSWSSALMLGARRVGNGLELNPVGSPEHWPETQTVLTPFGELRIDLTVQAGRATLSFSCERQFPISVRWRGVHKAATSQGRVVLSTS